MFSVDVLEQGARSNTALGSDLEYFQWEKIGERRAAMVC